MQIEKVAIESLIPYVNNAREHSEEQVDQIAASIKKFKFNNPVLIDQTSGILAGHGRVLAAKKLGLKTVPCIKLDHLSDAEKKAYIIADNKIATNSTYNNTILGLEIESLKDSGIDLNILGFNDKELNILSNPIKGLTDDDEVPEIPEEPVTKEGDIYELGDHKIFCGDCRIVENVNKLMLDKKANMVLTDPPYGVNYNKKNEYLNKRFGGNRITNYMEADDTTDFKSFSFDFIKNFKLTEYNTIYIWINGKNAYELCDSMRKNNIYIASQLIWLKNNHVLTRQDYVSKYEMCFYGWKDKHKFYGGFSTDVLEFDKPLKNKLHPTMKPIKMMEKLIRDGSVGKNIVYDGFLGSGSTLIACEKQDRVCYGFELNPIYCDVIIKRWENFTGKKAKLIN